MGLQVEFAPNSPLGRRHVPVMAGTGKEVVVWGGFIPGVVSFADGARYDLRSGGWQMFPEGRLAGRVRSASAWTGDELLIIGGTDHAFRIFDDGAAFAPAVRGDHFPRYRTVGDARPLHVGPANG